MNGGARPARPPRDSLPGLAGAPEAPGPDKASRAYWLNRLRPALADLSPDVLSIADAAIRACADPALLPIAALAALVAGQPDRAIGFLKRYERKYEPDKATTLLTALAQARQGHPAHAWTLLERDGLDDPREAVRCFVGGRAMVGWLITQITDIRAAHLRQQREARTAEKRAAQKRAGEDKAGARAALSGRGKALPVAAETPPAVPDLPRLDVALNLAFAFADPDAIQLGGAASDPTWFWLRGELTQLGLVEGFDELLCLPALVGVEAHWY